MYFKETQEKAVKAIESFNSCIFLYCFGILCNESIPHTTSNFDSFTDYSTIHVCREKAVSKVIVH